MTFDIIATLNYFGLTPDKIIPVILIGLFIWFFFSKSLTKFLKPINKSLRQITNAIIEIQTIFKQRWDIELDHKLLEAGGSPLRPTEYGAQLIRESGLEKILNEQKELLFSKLKEELPENYTEYDVQEMSRQVLLKMKTDPIINPVKTYAYQNAIDVDMILRVGGLWLRDDFLGQPRGIAKNP